MREHISSLTTCVLLLIVESVTLNSGMSVSTGGSFGEIKLDQGTIISVVGNLINLSTGGSVSAGSSVNVGGNTVSVDAASEVVSVQTSDGTSLTANAATGEKTLVKNGWGIRVDANGNFSVIIPNGSSPAAKIIATAVDVLGKAVQINQGAVWSVRDLLGNIITIPPTGSPLDLLDTQIGENGISAIGIKPTPDGPTIWIKLLKVDLDIVHPATGELDEAKEDVNDGGYVSIKREVEEEDVVPVTQLKLHANSSLPSTAKFRLKFADGGRYKIYSDETRQTLVESEVTEFDVGNPTTLYFQGLSKSQSRGGEEIMMQIGIGGSWYDGDSVKSTVVQSEFPVVIRAFIPYLWSQPEQPASFLDVIAGIYYTVIAEGDNRKALLRSDSIGVSYRMRQRIVLTPYYDLHSSSDLSADREETVADLSTHHLKQLSVPLLDLLDKHGDSWDSNGPTVHEEGPPTFTSSSYLKDSHMDKTVSFNIVGSGEDGAMPWYIPGAVTPNIDWDVDVSLDAFADPLNPRIAVIGTRDKFPAYEIIFEQSNGSYEQLYFFSPPYSRQPGITTLGFSEDFTSNIVTIE